MINYYEILEISPNASKEIIEKSYKVLAKKYHPDLNPDNKKEAEDKMKKLNEAYKVLIDDKKRENYDAIFKRKLAQESKRQTNSTDFSTSVDNQEIDNQTEKYYTDEDNNFVISTSHLDKKEQEKLKRKLQERYLEAYDEYLRSQGYRLKYKWTFKRILKLLAIISISLVVLTVLYFIPPINRYCHELYETNIIVKLFTDLVVSFIKAIFSIFK